MVAQPIRLDDYQGDPHGRRYGPEERETAYQTWKWGAGRSIAKTGELTGVAASTLGTWQQRDGWVERAKREDAELAESVRLSIAGKITGEAVKSIETVIEIRDDAAASKKDRLTAAFWLAGIAGVAPIAKAETSVLTATPNAPPQPKRDLRSLSDAELLALEREPA